MHNSKNSSTFAEQQVPEEINKLLSRIAQLEEIVSNLQTQKTNWESLYRMFPEGMLLCNKDHTILRANRAFLELFNIRLEKVLGRSLTELLVSDTEISGKINEILDKVLEDQSLSSCRLVVPGEDRTLNLEMNVFPFVLSEAEKGVLAIFNESLSSQQESGLAVNRVDLRGLLARVSLSLLRPGTFQETLTSVFRDICLSTGAEGIVFLTPSLNTERSDSSIEFYLDGESGDVLEVMDPELLRTALESEKVLFSGSFPSGNIDGTDIETMLKIYGDIPFCLIHVAHEGKFHGALLVFGEGMPDYFTMEDPAHLSSLGEILGAAFSRHDGEKVQERDHRRYRQIIDDQRDLVNTYDSGGLITYANRAFCNHYGLDREDVVGKNILDLVPHGEEEKKELKEKILSISSDFPIMVNDAHMDLPSGGRTWQQWMNKGVFDQRGRLTEIIGVGRDITRIKTMEEELKKTIGTLQGTFEATINAMGKIIEVKDPYTAGHQQNVADLTHAIALEMDLPQESVDAVYYASLVHDIGKIQIPSEILNKPGRLNEMEYSLVKNHPRHGYEILNTVEFPWPVANIVLQHHERLNGMGYPEGVAGDDILLEARIMGVADVVEAMSAHRPYRTSLGMDRALEEITKYAGTLYDKRVVEVCLSLFRDKKFTFRVDNGREDLPSMR